jgi:DNA-binding winged helix-turn-helix (wHTH) protein
MLLTWCDHVLDEERFELRRNGAKVPVQPKVLDFLFCVVRARGRVVSRKELFETVWAGIKVGETSLSRAVLEARRAIGDELQDTLVTVRGRGFRFAVDVVTKGGDLHGEDAADPTFVGRSSYLTCVQARLDDAARGHGGLVWISGDAGIGKTRTMEEIARRARVAGLDTFRAIAHEDPRPPPYWLWAQVLRAYAASHPSAKTSRFVESVESAPSGGTGPALEPSFPFFEEVTRFLIEASNSRPFLLVFDDVHWADAESLALLRFFAREARQSKVVVLCTYRDVDPSTRARTFDFGALVAESAALSVPLRGLAMEEISRLVQVATGAMPSETFGRALSERTGGNPMYVLQLLQTEWAERARAEASAAYATSVDIQQGLIDSIRRHLRVLSKPAHELLTLAAVLGPTFDLTELGVASGLPQEEILNRLDEGVSARLLRKSKAGSFVFMHTLVQRVLYKALPSAERAARHAFVADRLFLHYGPSADVHASKLALHFGRALPLGSPESALSFSIRAAENDLARAAPRRAERHWEAAVQALPLVASQDPRHVWVRLGLAKTYQLVGDSDAARSAFWEAAVVARALGLATAMAEAALGFARVTDSSVAPRRSLLDEAYEALSALSALSPMDASTTSLRAQLERELRSNNVPSLDQGRASSRA